MNKHKLYEKIKSGSNNVRFEELTSLIEAFGFSLKRIRGSHHIFVHPIVPRLVDIQPSKGQAKAYQVKQFLELVEMFNLELED